MLPEERPGRESAGGRLTPAGIYLTERGVAGTIGDINLLA
jgi:hypothetical protein